MGTSSVTDRLGGWAESTRLRTWLTRLRIGPFPDRWSKLTGYVVVVSFAVVLVSGVALLFLYTPSTSTVVYQGGYAPLHGVSVSAAYDSTVRASVDIPGGLLIRQLHAWSSSLMIAVLIVHILRVFFTGAFRGRGRIGWVILFAVLFVAMGAGLTGVILPDDGLSGSSLAVLDGLLKTVPLIGAWVSAVVFQGDFPSGAIGTFFPLHIAVLPLLLIVLGMWLASRRGPVPVVDASRARRSVIKHVMLTLAIVAVLTLLAATVTINPVWLYGPADPGNALAGAGAVWYLAFLDGAQRLVPPGLEFPLWGGTLTLAVLVPIAVIGAYFVAALAYPWVEGWITGDRAGTFEPQRPRTTPTRTGIGVAAMIFYGVLWAAAGADTIAFQFHLDFGLLILTLQVALILGPLAGYLIAKRVCLGLQRKDRDLLEHGRETGRIVRLPGGEYYEVHAPVGEAERDSILASTPAEPMRLRPSRDGRMLARDVIRARLSQWFSGDRVPPTSTEPPPPLEPSRAADRTRTRRPTAGS